MHHLWRKLHIFNMNVKIYMEPKFANIKIFLSPYYLRHQETGDLLEHGMGMGEPEWDSWFVGLGMRLVQLL